jgi:hypothetical protein
MTNYKLEKYLSNLDHFSQEISKLATIIKNDLPMFSPPDDLHQHVADMHQHVCVMISGAHSATDQIRTASKQHASQTTQEVVAKTFLVQKELWRELYEMAAPLRGNLGKIHVGLLFMSITEALESSHDSLEKMGTLGNEYIQSMSEPPGTNWFSKLFKK